LLELGNITAGYGETIVLRDVSLTVGADEVVSIVGANGAGKTTAVRCIAGLTRPRAGQIRFEGRDITSLPAHRRAALGIVLVPEGRKLFPEMSVRENLELGAYAARAKLARRASLERVCALFPLLRERLGQRAATLSGGEQQMLAVGRGLMALPKLLILDEPSLGLAPLVVREIFGVVAEIHRAGIPVLLVEQNVQQALGLSNRGLVLEGGAITLTGSGRDLLANAELKAAYLGL
jgi:branched-chain amino acid transport system ATP-binding protein